MWTRLSRSVPVGVLLAAAAAATVAAGGGAALAGGARVLPFSPLGDAKPGEVAIYKLEILDAGGRVVSTVEKRFEVKARELGSVTVDKLESFSEEADAPDIVKALRLVPPGTPLDGMLAKPEAITVGIYNQKIEAIRVSLNTKLKDGATAVAFDGWFSQGTPVFGLVRCRTRISGGGAGESVYELIDLKKPGD